MKHYRLYYPFSSQAIAVIVEQDHIGASNSTSVSIATFSTDTKGGAIALEAFVEAIAKSHPGSTVFDERAGQIIAGDVAELDPV